MASNSQSKTDKRWFDLQFHDEDQKSIKKPDEIEIDKKDSSPSTIDKVALDRILGSIFGMALGDALGAHVEFRPQSYLAANPVTDLVGGGTWGLQKGQFTDDTSMALCLANSLIAHRGFAPYDQLVRYKWWYRHGYMSSTGHCFDIGAATRQSIQEFEMRQKRFAQTYQISVNKIDFLSDPEMLNEFDVNCSQAGVAGNGALMRLAPVPLFFHRDPKKAVEYSGQSSRLTHGDDKSYDACRYYGALIVATLQGMKKDQLLSQTFYVEHRAWFDNQPLHQDIMDIVKGSFKKAGGYKDGIRGKGYVVSALEAALWAFWSDNDSFEIGALNAVNLGDDTDTTAAIYGQLAGAYYTFQNLPNKWLDQVYAKNFIQCVSRWVAYEGEQWFTNQKSPDVVEPTNDTNVKSTTTTSNMTIVPKEKVNPSTHKQVSTDVSSVHILLPTIERKAIDPKGFIGCFYDGCSDCLVESLRIHTNLKVQQVCLPVVCFIKKGDNLQCRNLLRLIGFDDELRLSVASDIVPLRGIASVVKYPYLINECTRVFYYSFTARQESLSDDVNSVKKSIREITSETLGTHIITEITRSIDVIVLLRLPFDQMDIIDETLETICQCLIASNTSLPDKHSLDRILSTHIYSNMHFFNEQKTIIDVCHVISNIKQTNAIYWPSTYVLQPIKEFLPNDNKKIALFHPLEQKIADKVERHLSRLSYFSKMWTTILDNENHDVLNTDLGEQLNEAKNLLSKLTDQYKNEKTRFKELITSIRQGNQQQQQAIEDQLLTDEKCKTLTYNIDDLKYSLDSLKQKADFINDLKRQGFKYINATKYGIKQGDNENTIQGKLINNAQQRFLCSDDTLNENNWKIMNDLCSSITKERKNNQDLDFIYVDFSYCSYELNEMKLFPTKSHDINPNVQFSIFIKKDTGGVTSLTSSSDSTINILLLGKSGVGKSHLINTFEGCFKFDTYTDFQRSKSAVNILIPFMYSIKDESEEHFALFGNNDPNEDYDHTGSSITQCCKSYIFDIGNGQKLRIIDTPGFSDAHDNKAGNNVNMQHILSCIANLTHFNAICILLESDDSKLEIYKPYLKQLFDFLGENAYKNIVFCFTKTLSPQVDRYQRNARLKSMLESLSINNIPCNNGNIFDFDSTFFHQSTAIQYLTTLLIWENSKHEESWNISNKGWNRLVKFVRANLCRYLLYQGLQREENVRLEIMQMVRPMLETIRNILRNLIIWNVETIEASIQLRAKPIWYPSAICSLCSRQYYKCGAFLVMSYDLHKYRDKCDTCSCDSSHHIRVDYQLEYEYLADQTRLQPDQLLAFKRDLFNASILFAHFLMHVAQNSREDPFLSNIYRMIDEERYLSDYTSYRTHNSQLHHLLVRLRHDYQKQMDIIKQQHLPNDLMIIYNWIKRVKLIPMVQIQMCAVTKIQEITT